MGWEVKAIKPLRGVLVPFGVFLIVFSLFGKELSHGFFWDN